MNGLTSTVKGVFIGWSLLVGGASSIAAFSGKSSPSTSLPGNLDDSSLERRSFLIGSTLAMAAPASVLPSYPQSARALGEGEQRMIFKQKPTAPIEALLPAVQQRLLLEAALDFSKKGEIETIKLILAPLDDSYVENINGNQNMKVIKKYNPAKVLRGDLVRATMNLYQTNLNYNNLLSNPIDAFTITDSSWKKSFIRANGGLPDLQKVIGADIDMRLLLRNQVQQKIDDAAAELYASDRDDEELAALLQEAARNFDQWLDRVRTGDIRDALQAALAGESVKLVDSYAAGFLPRQSYAAQ